MQRDFRPLHLTVFHHGQGSKHVSHPPHHWCQQPVTWLFVEGRPFAMMSSVPLKQFMQRECLGSAPFKETQLIHNLAANINIGRGMIILPDDMTREGTWDFAGIWAAPIAQTDLLWFIYIYNILYINIYIIYCWVDGRGLVLWFSTVNLSIISLLWMTFSHLSKVRQAEQKLL